MHGVMARTHVVNAVVHGMDTVSTTTSGSVTVSGTITVSGTMTVSSTSATSGVVDNWNVVGDVVDWSGNVVDYSNVVSATTSASERMNFTILFNTYFIFSKISSG